MKKKIIISMAVVLSSFVFSMKAQDGATEFSTKCAACHSIGNGRLVGPDLKGVHKKYNLKYLSKWIRSSQEVINSGDAKAVAMFEEYNSIVMPDFPDLKDADIKGIIDYIKSQSGEPEEKTTAKAATDDTKTLTTVLAENSTTPTVSETKTEPVSLKSSINASGKSKTIVAGIAAASKVTTIPFADKKTSEFPVMWVITSVGLVMLLVIFALTKVIFILLNLVKVQKSNSQI